MNKETRKEKGCKLNPLPCIIRYTLGTRGFSRVRRDLSAEGRHSFGRRPKLEKSLAPRVYQIRL